MKFKWDGNSATMESEDLCRKVELYWKDPNMSRDPGLVIITRSDMWNYSVGLTIDEAHKLRDYLNSVIPKGK